MFHVCDVIGPQHGQATNLIGQSGLCKPVVSQPLQLSTHLAGGWERAHEQYELSSLHFTMRSIAPNVQVLAQSWSVPVPWTRSWWSLGSGPGEETSPELFSVSALERRQVLVLVSNMLWEAVKVLVLVRLLEFQVPAMYAHDFLSTLDLS